jgi:SPP1 gp7 family putative phage head morphogenesis protein
MEDIKKEFQKFLEISTTPLESYDAIQFNPDELIAQKGIDIYHRIAIDPQADASLSSVIFPACSFDFEIQPKPEENILSEFIEFILNTCETSIHELLYFLADALQCGYAIVEIIPYRITQEKFRGKIGIQKLKSKDPRYFDFELDEYLNIKSLLNLSSPHLGIQLGKTRKLPLSRFLIAIWNQKYSLPWGTSILRSAYPAWKSKELLMKFAVITAENIAKGKWEAEVEQGKEELGLRILKNLVEKQAYIKPRGMIIEEKTPRHLKLDHFSEFFDKFNEEIAKGIAGQTLTTLEGASRAQGEVHQWILKFFILKVQRMLEDVLNTQLIRRMIDLNFRREEIKVYPIIRLSSTLLEQLSEKTEEEEKQEFSAGRPTIEIFEKLRIKRNLTKFERRLGISYRKIEKFYDLLLKETIEKLHPEFQTIREKFAKKIFQAITNPEKMKKIQPATEKIQDIFHQCFLTLRAWGMYHAVRELIKAGLEKLQKYEEFQQEELFSPKEGFEFFKKKIPVSKEEWDKMSEAERFRAFTIAEAFSAEIAAEAMKLIPVAIEKTWSYQTFHFELTRKLENYFGSAEVLSPARAETILRTNMSTVYNRGRKDIYEHPEVKDEIVAYQYSAIMDARVRPNHAAMDGKIFLKDDPIWREWWPPNGYNCRCTVIPILKGEKFEVAEAVDVRPDEGFRV